MRNDAVSCFKFILRRYNLEKEFKKLVAERGMSVKDYLSRVQSIFAVRAIINRYDDSPWAKFAVEWEDKVIINGYSEIMQEYVDEHGMTLTIKAVHILQEQGKWVIPSLHDVLNHSKINEVLNQSSEVKKEEPVAPKPEPPKPEPKKKTIVITVDKTKEVAKKKEEPKFSFTPIEDDDTYETISFDRCSHSVDKKWSQENLLRVTNKDKNVYVSFNEHISNICSAFPDVWVYLRRDKLTNELYLVFTKVTKPGSIHCRYQGNILILASKPLVEYLLLFYACKVQDLTFFEISDNRSRTDECVTIKILGKKEYEY